LGTHYEITMICCQQSKIDGKDEIGLG
jgi:hypothetical protein